MRLLVLGGTVFLGRAVARQARAAGHDVTCAARGVSGRPVDGVTFVTVDRDDPDGLAPLAGAEFDALVDVSRRPSHVRRAVAAFADRVGHAVYVSSCSVYADQGTPGQRAASAPTVEPAPPDVDETLSDAATYGRCKVASETAVRDGFGADRSFLCRAGLIVGPEDEMGRFDYWVRRIAEADGGEVLVPGTPDDAVQVVDVRDLAGWLLDAAVSGRPGTYDGIGAPMTRAEFVAGIAAGVGTAPEFVVPQFVVPQFVYVPQDFLVREGVRYWDGERSLPIWLPLPEYAGFLTRDVSASLDAGLRCRPLAGTARDTWEWLAAAAPAEDGAKTTAGPVPGIDRADEIDLLKGWRRTSL